MADQQTPAAPPPVMVSPITFPAANPIIFTVYGSDVMPATAVNEFSSLQLPAMWRGLRWICSTMAGFPKRVIQKRNGVSIHLEDHAVNALLNGDINEFTIPAQVFECWYHHAVIFGNGYLLIDRGDNFSPAQLLQVQPENVIPFRVLSGPSRGQWYLVKGGGMAMVVPAADMLHLPGLGFDGLCGYPLVLLMQENLQLAKSAQTFANRYFVNGTQVQGYIKVPATATTEQVEQIKISLQQRHAGIAATYSYAVLVGGAEMVNNTIPPEASQLLETRKYTVTDIARMLGVPPHILYQTEDLKYNTVEQMGQDAVRYSLGEWITKSEQMLTAKLLTRQERQNGLRIEFDLDCLVRSDAAAYADQTLKLLNGGVITANEARARHNLSPSSEAEAEKLRVPVSFPVAAMIGQQPAQPGLPARQSSREDFKPIIAYAARLVDQKTANAFERRKGKPREEVIAWSNVFAGEQAEYAKALLTPVAEVMAKAGIAFDVDPIAAKYASAIKTYAAGKVENVASLTDFTENPL